MGFYSPCLLNLNKHQKINFLSVESLIATNKEDIISGQDAVKINFPSEQPSQNNIVLGVKHLQQRFTNTLQRIPPLQADEGYICDDLHWGEEAALLDNSNVVLGTPLLPLDKTFLLHSNPTASKVIYLDFDGHTTTGTAWNNSTMGSSFYSPAFDTDGNPSLFSSAELTLIQNAWQRVAADFAAFDVDITTQAPPQDWLINSGVDDNNYGIRVVMSSYGPSASVGVGGIAYVNSFTSSKDTPVFVYNNSMLALANTISHEVGHSLGLSHDGIGTSAYYSGHGSGPVSWAPIMGASWSRNMSTWDNGIYYRSNNTGSTANYGKGADDIAIITGFNGFGLVADLEGDAQAQSVALQLNGTAISQFGTIQTAWDQDWFRLELLTDSQVNLRFDPSIYRAFVDSDGIWGGTVNAYTAAVNDANTTTSYTEDATNLDLRINVFNSVGSQLKSFATYGRFAFFSQILPVGSYYFQLDGQGYGDPTSSTPTGYSDYASIGNYLISGTVNATSAMLFFTGTVDTLTGTDVANVFQLNQLADALWSKTPDRIIGLQAGVDSIDSPFSRSIAIAPKLMGSIYTLDAAGIGVLLTSSAFTANGAATFSFGSGSTMRTFLALNNQVAGFDPASDSVIEITGFSGNLSTLSIF